jgi:hypothetical protein
VQWLLYRSWHQDYGLVDRLGGTKWILGSLETQMVGKSKDMGWALHKKFGKWNLQMSNEFVVNLLKYRCLD